MNAANFEEESHICKQNEKNMKWSTHSMLHAVTQEAFWGQGQGKLL